MSPFLSRKEVSSPYIFRKYIFALPPSVLALGKRLFLLCECNYYRCISGTGLPAPPPEEPEPEQTEQTEETSENVLTSSVKELLRILTSLSTASKDKMVEILAALTSVVQGLK